LNGEWLVSKNDIRWQVMNSESELDDDRGGGGGGDGIISIMI